MDKVKQFFNMIAKMFNDFDLWLKQTFYFDEKIVNIYEATIAPLAEWLKMVLLVCAILLTFVGLVVVIKKLYKVIITLLVVGIIAGVVLYFLIK